MRREPDDPPDPTTPTVVVLLVALAVEFAMVFWRGMPW